MVIYMVFYSPDLTNSVFSFILLTVNLFRRHTLIGRGLNVRGKYAKYETCILCFFIACTVYPIIATTKLNNS